MTWAPPGCYTAWLWLSGWQIPVMLADLAFFLAYLAISIRLLSLRSKAGLIGMSPWVLQGFAAFIFLCGSYHLVAAGRAFLMLYSLSVAVTLLGAVVSLAVAAFFWPFSGRLGQAIDRYIAGVEKPSELTRRASLLVERAELLKDDVRDLKALHAAALGGRDVF